MAALGSLFIQGTLYPFKFVLSSCCYHLQTEVFLPNGERLNGTLEHYSLHYNIALVSVGNYRARWPANIEPWSYKYSKVAAVGRCIYSGTLMAASGRLTDWSGTLDCKVLVYSSCKIAKVLVIFLCYSCTLLVESEWGNYHVCWNTNASLPMSS